MKPLLLVDGDGLAHRAFHGGPPGAGDVQTKAITGFLGMLARHWVREKAGPVFVAWDTLGVDTYRSDLWPDYQGGRFFDPSLVEQLNRLPEVCRNFGFGVGKEPGFEADDLIASLVQNSSGERLILSADKDFYQLVSATVTIIAPQKGGKDPERVTPAAVVTKLGVLPEQVPAFKALAGDSSDGIPGLKGVGPKSAASLLLKHGTLEGVLESWQRPEEVDFARRFLQVTTMQSSAKVKVPVEEPNWHAGCEVLAEMGLGAAADRILTISKQ